MPGRVAQKWRPSLRLVLGGTLLAVLVLPMFGLAAMPWLAGRIGSGSALLTVVAVTLGATSILAWLLLRLLLVPVQELTKRSEAILQGKAEAKTPLPHYGTAEVGQLGQSVLEMADALQSRETAMRAYVDHVTHELRTPLAAIRGSVELIEDTDGLPADVAPQLRRVAEAEARMEDLLTAARSIAQAREPLPIGTATLSDLCAYLTAEFPGLSLRRSGPDQTFGLAQSTLQIVLGHLVRNAREAGAQSVTLSGSSSAELWVENDGPLIADGNAPRIFDAFFTTNRDQGGSGMGLAIVHAMISADGGEVLLDQSGGTVRFCLKMPKP